MNIAELNVVESQSIKESYKKDFSNSEPSLVVNLVNDLDASFDIAHTKFSMTNEQIKCIELLRVCFLKLQSVMDPNRLYFTFSNAVDGEICLNRISENGISKLIINEDGVLAYSFISYKNSTKKDVLDFFTNEVDGELVALKFLSF
ncbi:MAG: hypothetical protein EAZ53_13555 [Bacteroidetes bacterium]|nr:MAG: hypothetical protein EAZ53_13555 [Bacteroidota bacterium]